MITGRRVFAGLVVLYTLAVVVILVVRIGAEGFRSDDIFVIPAVTGTAVGVYLTLKVTDNRMGPLMAVMSVSLVTLGLSNELIPWTLEHGGGALTVLSVHLSDVAWATQFVTAFVLMPLWFPTGRPISARWAWVGRAAIVIAAIAQLSFVVAESVCTFEDAASDACVSVENPWGIEGFAGFEWLFPLVMVMAIPAVASAFVRWRRSDDSERHQIKWVFVAAVGLLITLMILIADINRLFNDSVFAAALTGVWVAIAVAVRRYRLYDIDRILSRTVSYAVIIAVLAGIYIGLVTTIGSQFESSLAVAASTLAVAGLFSPLRRRVHRWVDKYFNRSSFDTAIVMDEFAGSLRDRVDADEVIEGWVGVIEDTMQPTSVGVWVKS
ncbi:MAG TPA: hypothetical protein VG872_04830 [Acidimicrobiia bacterium]|nr:hypothetical protein [Acidimicrobiia bacterium]